MLEKLFSCSAISRTSMLFGQFDSSSENCFAIKWYINILISQICERFRVEARKACQFRQNLRGTDNYGLGSLGESLILNSDVRNCAKWGSISHSTRWSCMLWYHNLLVHVLLSCWLKMALLPNRRVELAVQTYRGHRPFVWKKRTGPKGIPTCKYEDKFGAICLVVVPTLPVMRNDFLPFRFKIRLSPWYERIFCRILLWISTRKMVWGRKRQGIKMCWKSFGTHIHFSAFFQKIFKQHKILFPAALDRFWSGENFFPPEHFRTPKSIKSE